jgi:hypothetical protein
LRILDPDDRRAASPWFAHQCLAPAPVNPGETKLKRIEWHGLAADESPPFRTLAGERSEFRHVAVNGNFGRAVHHHLYPALEVVAVSAHFRAPALGAVARLSKYAKTRQKQSHSQTSHLVIPPGNELILLYIDRLQSRRQATGRRVPDLAGCRASGCGIGTA